MKDKTIEAFIAHAKEQYPTEACGLVVELNDTRQEVYLPAVNIAADPTVAFMIHPVFFADASDIGEIRAVFHSHPEGPDQCSEGDRVACDETGIPYYVVALYRQDNGELQTSMPFGIAPSGVKAPLLGRIFIHGIYDCYAVIRDWFSAARGVTLPDHVRQDNWWKKTPELDLYAANLEADGWRVLAEGELLKPGDMILMQLESKVINHAALYLGTEELAEAPGGYPRTDRILHHVYGRRSRVDMYAGMWKHCTVKVARHESQE